MPTVRYSPEKWATIQLPKYTLPPYFTPSPLSHGLTWEDTPQGHVYWYDVYMRLSALARQSYEGTPPESLKHNKAKKDFHIVVSDIEYILSVIADGFLWEATFEGHVYWSNVFSELTTLLESYCPSNSSFVTFFRYLDEEQNRHFPGFKKGNLLVSED